MEAETEFVPDEEATNPGEVIKKLREKLKACQAERQEFLETSQRLKADYVNLARQIEAERSELVKYVKETFLVELLDLADTFELAFANRQAWEAAPENWRKGVEYIYSKLTNTLQKNGVTEINPLGEPFDPARHHSIMTIDTPNPGEDNKVLEVIQKGYLLNGKVIRPAQVKVGHLKPNT